MMNCMKDNLFYILHRGGIAMILLWMSTSLVSAQCVSDDPNDPCCNGIISTDPDDPFNPETAQGKWLNRFDWRLPNLLIFLGSYSKWGNPWGSDVQNPFWNTSNDALRHISFRGINARGSRRKYL